MDINKKDLTRVNKMVYKKFLKAHYIQQEKMVTILKEQLENLKLLLNLMEKEL